MARVALSDQIHTNIRILITAIILTFISIPLLLIIFIVSIVLRTVSIVVAKIFRQDLHQIYNDLSTRFAIESVHTRPKGTILIFLVCDGPVSLKGLQTKFINRLLSYQDPRARRLPYIHLKQYLVQFMGYLYWKFDADFKIENHVRMYDYESEDCRLPEAQCREDDLQRVAGLLVNQPFPKGQSPWELLVIPNYELGQNEKLGTVLALRIHHSMADGYSILGILNRLFQFKTNNPPVQFVQMSLLMRILRTVQIFFKLPWDLAEFFEGMKDPPNAWNLVGVKMARKYHTYFSKSISVSDLKTIAKSYGVTYNAVIYSITAGAVVRMMKDAGLEVPVKLTSTYPKPLPGHPGGLSTHALLSFFNFYPHDMTAEQRLRHIGKSVQPARVFQSNTFSISWMLKLLSYYPAPLHRSNGTTLAVTMGFSSFRGSSSSFEVDDNSNVVGILCVAGIGHGTSAGGLGMMTSLADNQRITLAVDHAVLRNCKLSLDFARHVKEEMRELTYAKETVV